MMMRIAVVLFVLALSGLAQAQTLDIYVIDVEGGNATLFVTPAHDSLLIDTGNAGAVASVRDAGRILEAMKDAGVQQIDHLITTHWHGDHFGGMPELASRVTIKEFIDHGPNIPTDKAADDFVKNTYPPLYGKGKHTVVKPGDRIQVAGLEWRIVAAGGEHITSPVPGGGKANPSCASFKPQDVDMTENAQSVGSHIIFGKFRAVHLGDLTWHNEFDMMCPQNRLGTVDLWIVSHHGQAISNSPMLAHALQARAAIMNNGTRKGGQPDAMKVIHSAPGLEDLWQLHFSQLSGQEYTVPGMFIANTVDDQPAGMAIAPMTPPQPGPGAPPPPAHNGQAFWIKISASADGTFTVTNARNGFSKTYRKP